MYIILFITFFKRLLFGAREGGQARPNYDMMSDQTELCDRNKGVCTVAVSEVTVLTLLLEVLKP